MTPESLDRAIRAIWAAALAGDRRAARAVIGLMAARRRSLGL